MNFLEQIINQKHREVDRLKAAVCNNSFQKLFNSNVSTVKLIAEIKPRSPSAGQLYQGDLIKLAQTYEAAGADALSVLTDEKFFGGSPELLTKIKMQTKLPILRKDFIIDEFQIYQTQRLGAEAVLLIASLLSAPKLKSFIKLCQKLGILPLVEIFNRQELKKALAAGADYIGVNARNLKTFKLDVDQQLRLIKKIPRSKTALAFSAIQSGDDVLRAKEAGARGVLVGTVLLQADNVADKIKELKLY